MEIKVGDVTAKWDEYEIPRLAKIPVVYFVDSNSNRIAVPQSLIEAVARQL